MAASRILSQGGNPYSGGAVILDSTPYTQYYLQQQAKEQAKAEALDKYYQDQVASISSKGLRDVDMNYFGQKYKELQNLYMQNKDAIKNPTKYGFEKAQEYNQRRQELINLPSISKQAQDEKLQALKISMNPANREILDMNTFGEDLRLHDLPINDPRRKAVDLANVRFLAKPLTPSELNSYINTKLSKIGTTGTYGESKKVGNYMVETPYTEEYSKDNLKKLGENIKAEGASNSSLKRTANMMFANAPENQKAELSKIHEQYFGKPIIEDEDILAALGIQSGLAAKKTKAERVSDFGGRQALSNTYISGRQSANKKSNTETYDFLKKGTEVLQSGNADLANQYFSTWKASAKNEVGGNIGFQNVSYTPAGWIKIQYNAPITKRQDGVSIIAPLPSEVILNPKDPQLLNKITGLHQQFTGSDVKVEKAAQKEAGTPVTPKPKEIKRSEIAARAAAAGYTAKEYEKLLKEKNIVIK